MTAQAVRASLVRHCDSDQLGRLFPQELDRPGMGFWVVADPSKLRGHPDDQQASQIPIAHLGDPPQALLAAAASGSGRQPQPGGKLPARGALMRIGHKGRQGRGRDDANAWNSLETLHDRVIAGPAHQIPLKVPDPGLQVAQVLRQGDENLSRQRRNAQRLSIEQPRHTG